MTLTEKITAAAVFLIAGILALLAVRHFMQRGFLLNNAYIYASEKERETMDKAPHYRQSAIVFCLLSLVFIVIGLSIVLQNGKLLLLELPLTAGAIAYAVISSAKQLKKPKR